MAYVSIGPTNYVRHIVSTHIDACVCVQIFDSATNRQRRFWPLFQLLLIHIHQLFVANCTVWFYSAPFHSCQTQYKSLPSLSSWWNKLNPSTIRRHSRFKERRHFFSCVQLSICTRANSFIYASPELRFKRARFEYGDTNVINAEIYSIVGFSYEN